MRYDRYLFESGLPLKIWQHVEGTDAMLRTAGAPEILERNARLHQDHLAKQAAWMQRVEIYPWDAEDYCRALMPLGILAVDGLDGTYINVCKINPKGEVFKDFTVPVMKMVVSPIIQVRELENASPELMVRAAEIHSAQKRLGWEPAFCGVRPDASMN